MSDFTALWHLMNGYQKTQVLWLVVRFGTPDLLKDGPLSAEEIAAKLPVNREYFTRLLRAAAGLGILARDQETLKYSLNDLSKQLVDGPGSMKWLVLHNSEPACVRGWLSMEKTIATGVHAFKEEIGADLFTFYAQNPESSERFNKQ